jgi:hypothetical protein
VRLRAVVPAVGTEVAFTNRTGGWLGSDLVRFAPGCDPTKEV